MRVWAGTQEAFVSGDFATKDKPAFIKKNRLGKKKAVGQACSGFAHNSVAFDFSGYLPVARPGRWKNLQTWGLDIQKNRKKSKEIDRKKKRGKRYIYGSKTNKEIRNYQESCLWTEPVSISPACYRCGGRDLFWLGKVWDRNIGWLCILWSCPFRSLWFFQYHGMNAEQFVAKAYQVHLLYPKPAPVVSK